jgi:hypothetical protein
MQDNMTFNICHKLKAVMVIKNHGMVLMKVLETAVV